MSTHSCIETFNQRFKVGDIVRHFKWFDQPVKDVDNKRYLYEIIALGNSTEDESMYVVYRSLENSKVWIRPLSQFCSSVKVSTPFQFYRFEVYESSMVNYST